MPWRLASQVYSTLLIDLFSLSPVCRPNLGGLLSPHCLSVALTENQFCILSLCGLTHKEQAAAVFFPLSIMLIYLFIISFS